MLHDDHLKMHWQLVAKNLADVRQAVMEGSPSTIDLNACKTSLLAASMQISLFAERLAGLVTQDKSQILPAGPETWYCTMTTRNKPRCALQCEYCKAAQEADQEPGQYHGNPTIYPDVLD